MSISLTLPILSELVQGGFRYGCNLLAKFDPHSIWYETSLTIAAHALRSGVKTEYHTFQHMPRDVRDALTRLGLNVKRLEEETILAIIDSYTAQTGIGVPEKREGRLGRAVTESLKISDWSIGVGQSLKETVPESAKGGLHVDDNLTVLLQYNSEKEMIDFWRTRMIPLSRAHENILLHSLLTGVASDAFYRQFESLCDGIIEFKSEESAGQIAQHIRVAAMRGRTYDSRWRRISLLENGEVILAD